MHPLKKRRLFADANPNAVNVVPVGRHLGGRWLTCREHRVVGTCAQLLQVEFGVARPQFDGVLPPGRSRGEAGARVDG